MTKEEIKKLDDATLVKMVFDALDIKDINQFEEREDIPYNTSSKWKCKKGIPTELPKRGGYRQLFISLLIQAQQEEEIKTYKEYFNLQKKIHAKYL